MADALDLGSSGVIRRGSTPLSRTKRYFWFEIDLQWLVLLKLFKFSFWFMELQSFLPLISEKTMIIDDGV